jgi:hypothetical protein
MSEVSEIVLLPRSLLIKLSYYLLFIFRKLILRLNPVYISISLNIVEDASEIKSPYVVFLLCSFFWF